MMNRVVADGCSAAHDAGAAAELRAACRAPEPCSPDGPASVAACWDCAEALPSAARLAALLDAAGEPLLLALLRALHNTPAGAGAAPAPAPVAEVQVSKVEGMAQARPAHRPPLCSLDGAGGARLRASQATAG